MSLPQIEVRLCSTQLYHLPPELIGRILSFVDVRGLQNLATTSKTLSRITVEMTCKNVGHDLRVLINILVSRLDKRTRKTQIKELISIKQKTTTTFPNLLSLKKYILSLRVQVLEVLTTLSQEELTPCEAFLVPFFFETIWVVAKIYNKTTYIKNIPRGFGRTGVLLAISNILIGEGLLDKAAKVALMIPDDFSYTKVILAISHTLMDKGELEKAADATEMLRLDNYECSRIREAISKALIDKGKVERAIVIAQSIQSKNEQENTLHYISKSLANKGEFERALVVAQKIHDVSTREYALCDISVALTNAREVNQAVVIAQDIQNKCRREHAFHNISIALTKAGEVNQAIVMAQDIQNKCRREHVFCDISITLAEKGDMGRAVAIARTIPSKTPSRSENFREEAIYHIAKAFTLQGKIDRAISMAEDLSILDKRASALRSVYEILASKGEVVRALRIAVRISTMYKYPFELRYREDQCAIKNIFKTLVANEERLDQALAIVKEIQNAHLRESVLENISRALVAEGEVDRAMVMATRIKNPQLRALVLGIISQTLTNKGEIDRAFAVAIRIINIHNKVRVNPDIVAKALHHIYKVLVDQDKVDKAIRIRIRNEFLRAYAFEGLVKILAEKGEISRATIVAERTPSVWVSHYHDTRTEAFRHISFALVNKGEIDKAIAVTGHIQDRHLHARTLKDLSHALVNKGEIDKAIAVAKHVPDMWTCYRNDIRTEAFRYISFALVDKGECDKAIAVAGYILDKQLHTCALKDLSHVLIDKGEFDKAITVAEHLHDQHSYAYVLKNLDQRKKARLANLPYEEKLKVTLDEIEELCSKVPQPIQPAANFF